VKINILNKKKEKKTKAKKAKDELKRKEWKII
jgi:hypothetical protein